MGVIIEPLTEQDIVHWGDYRGLTLRVKQLGPNRWVARFDYAEVVLSGGLASRYGDGPTPCEAISNYCREISGERMRIMASPGSRRELEVPTLTYDGAATADVTI